MASLAASDEINVFQLIPQYTVETPAAIYRVSEKELEILVPVLLRNSHLPITVDLLMTKEREAQQVVKQVEELFDPPTPRADGIVVDSIKLDN